jgi:hypothetical protein
LHQSIDRRSLDAITARAGHLQKMTVAIGTLAGKLVPEVSAVAGRVQDLVDELPEPVANALHLSVLFDQMNQDLDAFDPLVQTTPEFLKLKADVTAGQVLAKTVNDSLAQIQTRVQTVADEVHTLQRDVMSLQTKLGALLRATVTNAEETTQARVDASVQGLDAEFATDVASAQQGVAGAGKSAQERLTHAQTTADDSVAAVSAHAQGVISSTSEHAQRQLAVALADARQKVAAARLKFKQIESTVHAKAHAALAAAKKKAKEGGQAALAAAQTAAAKAETAAQSALTTANDDYANLLALNQQAVAWELPGGDATGVSEQEGSLIYTIAGS